MLQLCNLSYLRFRLSYRSIAWNKLKAFIEGVYLIAVLRAIELIIKSKIKTTPASKQTSLKLTSNSHHLIKTWSS